MERVVVDLFLCGYERLYLITRRLADGEHGQVEEVEKDKTPSQPGDDVRAQAERTAIRIKREFEELFSRQDGVAPALCEELRYALTALTDEMLLHETDWPGRQVWFDYLIEEQQYRTSIAGRRLFRQIDTLPDRFADPESLDQLATVYLMVLQLGFCGELRYQSDALAEYRRRLNRLRLQPELPEQVCPQAYNHNLCGKEPQKLAAMRSWWRWIAFGIALFMAASLAVWVVSSYELKSVLKAQLQYEQVQAGSTPSATQAPAQTATQPLAAPNAQPPGNRTDKQDQPPGTLEVKP